MRKYPGISTKWYDIGLELFNEKDTTVLEEIEYNHRNDVNKCCTEMFKTWLHLDPNATWDKLCAALYHVNLRSAAKNIKSEVYISYIFKNIFLHKL